MKGHFEDLVLEGRNNTATECCGNIVWNYSCSSEYSPRANSLHYGNKTTNFINIWILSWLHSRRGLTLHHFLGFEITLRHTTLRRTTLRHTTLRRTTLRHTTLDRTPLDQWSTRRRGLYLTTFKNHNRQTAMPPVGIEPATPSSERPQTGIQYDSSILLCYPGPIQWSQLMSQCPSIHSHHKDNTRKISSKQVKCT
jgi:hypothetical protein